ncbi:hypothetical protein FHS29_002847 [Saccharothrix tamanrassetensis]|uniref:Secreted protein n=1 Tax=Saccharothrix tamanrassetensis TaxID=1051531 RepID=A0A841CG02_9PSEU|nr:hypothetical protein [Saccharothrix tamanrassetensis]MBB5956261.1 hypothetical protein [Saccharothrix tamanrassetensis]
MLKKAGTFTAITAGMLLMASPAYAGEPGGSDDVDYLVSSARDIDSTHQMGLVNLEDSEVLSDLNVCHLDVNVIAVPILSNNDQGHCSNPDVEVDEDHDHEDHHHHWGHGSDHHDD